MSASSWTGDRVQTLIRLWRDGASASQIARNLGGVTRNAVIGKVHRLGLSGRAPPSTPGQRRLKPQTARRLPRPAAAPARARAMIAPPTTAAPDVGLASVVSVGRTQCRWPIGDPKAGGFCLCGRAATRGAYCAAHAALAYRPTPRDHLLRLAGLG